MEDKYLGFGWPEELKKLADEVEEIEDKLELARMKLARAHRETCKKLLCRKRCRMSPEEKESLKIIVRQLFNKQLEVVAMQRSLPDVTPDIIEVLDDLESKIRNSGMLDE
jgi:predicted RNase H-like nuclease (RuvC/YqgF family)